MGLGLFQFLKLFFRFLYAIDEFITVFKVFYRCFGSKNELKNRFLGKKNRFLYAIDEFITVLKVFYRCFGSKNELKNRFLGKKNSSTDFSTTTVAEI